MALVERKERERKSAKESFCIWRILPRIWIRILRSDPRGCSGGGGPTGKGPERGAVMPGMPMERWRTTRRRSQKRDGEDSRLGHPFPTGRSRRLPRHLSTATRGTSRRRRGTGLSVARDPRVRSLLAVAMGLPPFRFEPRRDGLVHRFARCDSTSGPGSPGDVPPFSPSK